MSTIASMPFPGFTTLPLPRNGCLPLLLCTLPLAAPPVPAEIDLASVRDLVSEERVAETLAHFAGRESRVAGYPGADAAARYIRETFRGIGLAGIETHEYDVSVPLEEAPGSLRVTATGETAPLHGLWPNLVKTSTLPDGGRIARLIDGGDGSYAHLDGKQVEDAVVLMDFNTGDAWLKCAYLGAAGVVFIEPDSTVYLEGERKFLTMPLDLPRYWVPREEGVRLRERISMSPGARSRCTSSTGWIGSGDRRGTSSGPSPGPVQRSGTTSSFSSRTTTPCPWFRRWPRGPNRPPAYPP